MLFVLIAVAITYYLVGFGSDEGLQVTDRTIQELHLYPSADKKIPESVISKLEPMKKDAPMKREAFLQAIKSKLTAEEWTSHEKTISELVAPEPIPPFLKVVYVLLFSIVGMGGSYCGGLVRHPRQHLRQLPHRLRLAARRAVGRRQHPAAGGHVDRPVPDLARTGHDGDHPAVRAARRSSASASSASPSANRSAPRRCASPAVSSPRSPTSAPT